ncbi:MAG TPA: hypothetical protein PKC13_11675, partial [Blastocatellia bacterium]|nr:hypothetical protein [Blastocatellia bacterium]
VSMSNNPVHLQETNAKLQQVRPQRPPATPAPIGPRTPKKPAVSAETLEAINQSNAGSLVKPNGTINVVVYDDSDYPAPDTPRDPDEEFSADKLRELSFWWKQGGTLYTALQFADVVVGAASWEEALRETIAAVDKKGGGKIIGSLQFWGHGSPGHAFMGGDPLRSEDFDGKPLLNRTDLLPLIHQIRDRMHPKHGSVWFRSCSPFQGEKGKMFAARASQQFGATAVGHTFNIHVWQSGTFAVEPGAWPDWPNDLGVHDHGKHKGELQISLPLRQRTVGIFQFYPPIHGVGCSLPTRLIGLLRNLFR